MHEPVDELPPAETLGSADALLSVDLASCAGHLCDPAGLPLSLVVTTLDNAATLARCLDSLPPLQDAIVLDSGSSDASVEIARARGARVQSRPFRGYGPQKTAAIELARCDWVLLLDADEWLSAEAAAALRELFVQGVPGHVRGYTLARREWLFWQFQHRWTRMNRYLRLFRRDAMRMSDAAVHAAPRVDGPVGRLPGHLMHDGERDIGTKVAKVNAYAAGTAEDRIRRGVHATRLRMIAYPPLFFLRNYLFKRQFLNGWAGFIASVIGAFYVFLKYARVYEARRAARGGRPRPEA
jgi:glycosyltransferase involved in cell wall biosynthesis